MAQTGLSRSAPPRNPRTRMAHNARQIDLLDLLIFRLGGKSALDSPLRLENLQASDFCRAGLTEIGGCYWCGVSVGATSRKFRAYVIRPGYLCCSNCLAAGDGWTDPAIADAELGGNPPPVSAPLTAAPAAGLV